MDLEVFDLDEKELIKNIDEPDGLILKEMNPCFLSSDAHTPMSPMRTTQPNIGLQLVNVNASSERFGVSKELYGGVGPTYCKDPRYLNAPRTMWHVRTGLHEEISPLVSPHNKDLNVMKNKSMFASPVTEVGNDVYDLWCNSYVDRRVRTVERSLFPRSIVWELDYIKNENHKVMLAALERERQAFEEKKMRKRDQANQNQIDQDAKKIGQKREVDACKTAPPFWWDDASGRPIQSAPEPQTCDFLYTTDPSGVSIETPDIVREMELDSSQGYIPGEIYKGDKVPVQVKKEDCSKAKWSPTGVDFHKTYDPSHNQGNLNGSKETPFAGNGGSVKNPSRLFEGSDDQVDCSQPLVCQCHNKRVHKHLGRVNTSTPLRPVVPHKMEEAAEVTAGGCMSVSGICGCESFKQGQRVKTDKPKLIVNDFPGTKIKYTPYEEQERQDEMFKVGLPFGMQAAKWMDKNKDPLPPRPPPKPPSPWRE